MQVEAKNGMRSRLDFARRGHVPPRRLAAEFACGLYAMVTNTADPASAAPL
ncbi:hypothetical protein JOF33_001812 [Corynebacterium freneyi]|uniref:Uncharacterized protein n=1 Tax=Corynebacterium freneyi TaxID=134034 RepID=A0ABS4U9B4_9CORY|nr:hypothetical protein [Corynebacterium freneyi]WJZ04785.1 hypothetical protein CFREN_04035 [Corynebacterium freneyi]